MLVLSVCTFILRRFGSYAVSRLHMAHAYTSRTLLPLPPNASWKLCRSATDSAKVLVLLTSAAHCGSSNFLRNT